ncbi:MAG: Rossmann-like and DUF2520 domain-containing protein [Calditrichaceae bacterium]
MNKILILGAGKVGTSLNIALRSTGYSHVLMAGRQGEKDSEHGTDYHAGLSNELLAHVDLIFICVQDSKIADTVNELRPFNLSGKKIVHTSGAYDSRILDPLRGKDAKTGSFHPIQTFPKKSLPLKIWNGIVCTYEGDKENRQILSEICTRFNARLLPVTPEQKTALHLAAVVSANYMVALFSWAENIISDAGIKKPPANEILGNIIEQVAKNYKDKSAENILTGPLARGDSETIEKHLDYLKKNYPAKYSLLYKKMAELLLDDRRFNIPNRDKLEKLL